MSLVPAGARVLVEFKAGRLIRDGSLVKPDTRKGLLRVIRTEDGLVHVEWCERKDDTGTAAVEYDEIVFPDEANFEKPSKAPPRVYILKFKEQSDRDIMFWMQEANESVDADVCRRVDRAINTPMGVDYEDEQPEASDIPQEVASTDALLRGHTSNLPGAGTEYTAGDSIGFVPQAPGQQPMAPAQLAALLSGMAGSGSSSNSGPSGLSDPGASLAAALLAALARQQRGEQQREMAVAPGPGLSEVLRPEVLAPLLQDPEVLERLSSFLPEEQRSHGALRALAHSPQFHQQLSTFSAALQTGQMDLAQFGLQSEGFAVADFLRAIQDLVERESGQSQQGQHQ